MPIDPALAIGADLGETRFSWTSTDVLLYHLATSSFPIRGRTLDDLRRAHADGARQALKAARPDLPQALAAAIESARHEQPRTAA